MNKILIAGCDCNIGSYLGKIFKNENEEINLIESSFLNGINRENLLDLIMYIKPNIIIHCASNNDIDLCEQEETLAYSTNTLITLNLAYCCNILDIPIFFISTNQVYGDNDNIPYFEKNICTPINVYGKTMLAGERLIQTICNKFFIIRIGYTFGGEDCFIKKILNSKEIRFFFCSEEVTSVTHLQDLYNAIVVMMNTNNYGIYNCACKESVSKSFLIRSILDYTNISKNVIELPVNFLEDSAPRPFFTAIDSTLIQNTFKLKLNTWKKEIENYIKEYINYL